MEGSLLSSDERGKGVLVDVVNSNHRITELPNDLLVKILSTLSTDEAARTSVMSKKWEKVWKETSDLYLDMRKMAKFGTPLSSVIHHTRSMTKVINDHRDYLDSCIIYYYAYQCESWLVESWIQSLIHVKHIKHLKLENSFNPFRLGTNSRNTLDLPSKIFSHPNLKSLYLGRYKLESSHAFNSCWNPKNLKLVGVFAKIGVFNVVLLSCPSLEVVILHINCHTRSGPLKIGNPNLKFLYLLCNDIDGIEVSTPYLEILIVSSLRWEMENFVIANPRLQFNRNYWSTRKIYPHTSYYISCPGDQEQKSIGHEFMMSESSEYMRSLASMSISVDLTNTKEVTMLKEVLVAWPEEMQELEIAFKNSNAPKKEGESSIGRTHTKFWEETKPFPNAYFRAYTVWLFNFSGTREEFALASRLITQGTVVKTLVIKPSLIALCNQLEIEAAMAKLRELPKGHKELSIEMF